MENEKIKTFCLGVEPAIINSSHKRGIVTLINSSVIMFSAIILEYR